MDLCTVMERAVGAYVMQIPTLAASSDFRFPTHVHDDIWRVA
jgi:hypothetical protein